MKVSSESAVTFVPTDLKIRIESKEELDILFTAVQKLSIPDHQWDINKAERIDSLLAPLRMELVKIGAIGAIKLSRSY